jgi:hypothetical protein
MRVIVYEIQAVVPKAWEGFRSDLAWVFLFYFSLSAWIKIHL